MILISKLEIDVAGKNINVEVETEDGNTIEEVLFWDVRNYKDPDLAIDLTDLTSKSRTADQLRTDPRTNTETFKIPIVRTELERFDGIFFVKFTSNEEEPNTSTGIVANFIKYHDCLLDKVLELKIDGCLGHSDECTDCTNCVFLLNTLLTSIYTIVQRGYYEEAKKIILAIEDICNICHTCPEYGDTQIISGLGIKTVENSVILI